jgi:thioredoxin reductase
LIEGSKVTRVDVQNGKVIVNLVDASGATKSLTADHVLLATGYKVNMQSLRFLDSQLAQKLNTVENTPVLSSNFESSVPGLYFVGASAANTFGPLLRFAFGAGFASRRLSRHLATLVARNPVTRPSGAAYESVRAGEEAGVR